jgi:hypothetical protein
MANNLLPLFILFVVVGIAAFVGFVVYSIVQDIGNKTKARMEKKNVLFTKDGMKVGVKELKDEDYKDKSQRCVPFSFLAFGLLCCKSIEFHSWRPFIVRCQVSMFDQISSSIPGRSNTD